jgi:hypothetical protein
MEAAAEEDGVTPNSRAVGSRETQQRPIQVGPIPHGIGRNK